MQMVSTRPPLCSQVEIESYEVASERHPEKKTIAPAKTAISLAPVCVFMGITSLC